MNTNQWIREALSKSKGDRQTVYGLYEEFLEATGSAMGVDTFKRRVRQVSRDMALLDYAVKATKGKQKALDLTRIHRKVIREGARVENALTEYNAEIKRLLEGCHLERFTTPHEQTGSPVAGILHLSDIHFNELVALAHNRYDFQVIARRLKMLVDEAKAVFRAKGVRNVLLANTGDSMNSDRRLDEYLNQATNRSMATILGVYLLEQVILDLNKEFNVSVAFVSGNESRVKDEPGYSDMVATDNYDYTILMMLYYLFRSAEGVQFIFGDPLELVVNVAGQNILLLHGNQVKSDVEKSVQQIKGKYADRGIIIRYILMGHTHSSRIGDTYSRSSSLVGDNDYSAKGLQLSSRASQSIHLVHENGNIDSMKIDLQNTDGVEGYQIIEELAAYNARSAARLHERHTIFEVVV